MDLVNRLKFYMDSKGIAISQFADSCGIPRPTMSQILNGRNKKVSDELIAKIHSSYPDLSVLWLMFGEGPMLSNANIEISEPQNAQNPASSSVLSVDNGGNTISGVPSTSVQDFGSEKSAMPNSANFGANSSSSGSSAPSSLPQSPAAGSAPRFFEGLIDFEFENADGAGSSSPGTADGSAEEGAASSPLSGVANDPSSLGALLNGTPAKRITNIVVFYSDNSFQSFFPG